MKKKLISVIFKNRLKSILTDLIYFNKKNTHEFRHLKKETIKSLKNFNFLNYYFSRLKFYSIQKQ